MSSARIVWHIQLPPEFKAAFEKLAEDNGDSASGNGAREVRRVLHQVISNRLEKKE